MIVYAVREFDNDKLFDSFEKAKDFAFSIINDYKEWLEQYNNIIIKIIDKGDKIILKEISNDKYRICHTFSRTIRKKEIKINWYEILKGEGKNVSICCTSWGVLFN